MLTDGCEKARQEASAPGGLNASPWSPCASLGHKMLASAFCWCFCMLSKRRRMGGKAQPQDTGLFTVGRAKISVSTTYAKFIGSYIFPLFTHKKGEDQKKKKKTGDLLLTSPVCKRLLPSPLNELSDYLRQDSPCAELVRLL